MNRLEFGSRPFGGRPGRYSGARSPLHPGWPRIFQLVALAAWVGGIAGGVASAAIAGETVRRPSEELRPWALEPLPVGAIRPAGWLKEQLQIQAEGLSGHLDEFWSDIQNSGWIGGKAEGWERMPYWLDGVLPLVYQIEAPELKRRVLHDIDTILAHQQEDGWLGPERSATGHYQARDPWPVFVMLKVLTQYYEASRDPRVIPAMTRFFEALRRQLADRPLFDWNRMRWQDGVVSLYWLYDRTSLEWLLELARTLNIQGYDWRHHFDDLPDKAKVTKWEHESHVVNNAMGVKATGLWFRQSGDPADAAAALQAIAALDRYHGQASGVFSGDECFAGRMPSQGTETCAVVEYMYSLETLTAALGDAAFGDRLELIAFNGLPAAFKPDMWGRQYVQQANQVLIKVSEDRVYTTNGPRSNLYGLETNYGCCTANMHQGWPKFIANLWMRTPDDGLAAVAYGPAEVRAQIRGVAVDLKIDTAYPFAETIGIEVTTPAPVSFPLKLRVPGWTRDAVLWVGGQSAGPLVAGSYFSVEREWQGTTRLRLTLPMPIRVERRFHQAVSVRRGPLVYSLKVGEDWKQVAGEAPHGDWEVYPTTPWNYALELSPSAPESSFEVVAGPLRGNPYRADSTPVHLTARGRLLPQWTLEKNAAAPPPLSPVVSDQPLTTLTLVPYGAAKLRVTEMPVLETP